MNAKWWQKLAWAGLALAMNTPGYAEDVDLFARGGSNSTIPNLLIILDNTSNWSSSFTSTGSLCGSSNNTKFCGVKMALHNAVSSISTSPIKLRVGLMLFNYNTGVASSSATTANQTGNNDGAFVRYAILPMGVVDGTDNKAALLNIIDNLDIGNDKGPGASQNAMSLEEARRYFGGLAVLNGNNTYYSKNGGPQVLDLRAENSAYNAYVSPVTSACQNNFILFISNGPPPSNDQTKSEPFVKSLNGGTDPPQYQFTPSNSVSNWMDEFAHLLFSNFASVTIPGNPPTTVNYNIITYGTTLRDPLNQNDNQNSALSARLLVQSAATHAGGKYCDATDINTLQACIDTAFAEIQSVNSTFVSATLPLAVNIQGTYLNQVYMGMFRPDLNDSPRWIGNMKEYKLSYDPSTGAVSLVDSVNLNVVNPATGFVSPSAKSFWSTDITGTSSSGTANFWTNYPLGSATTTYPQLPVQDNPDGEFVEKGGTAQQIRTAYLTDQSMRKVFSCPLSSGVGACSGALSGFAFNTTNITGSTYQTAFGATSSAELSDIVNWVRGTDNNKGSLTGSDPTGPGTTNAVPSQTVTIRPYVHGDVLHSRPVILNYGSGSTGPLVAYYGANDGMLHAVCVGQPGSSNCQASPTTVAPGQELWAFVPPEAFGKLKRLRDGQPLVALPDVIVSSSSPTPTTKNYFFDGSIDVFDGTNRSGVAQKIIYVSARRGGNFIYAFDVTDRTAPLFLWKIDNTTVDGNGNNFSKLAQTWSTPEVAHIRNPNHPYVVIFGAGYCGHSNNTTTTGVGEDADPPASCPNINDGVGVYVVDAFTGALVKFFHDSNNVGGNMSKSVASDVALVDQDRDGLVDRLYVGDTGGTLWRMDIDDPSEANWSLVKLAIAKKNWSGSTDTTVEKFFYPPDIVQTASFNAILIGTGDREHPRTTTANNRFYMFKDFNGKLTTSNAGSVQAITDYSSTSMIDVSTYTNPALLAAAVAPSTVNGWYYPLSTSGEKVVNAPLTLAGITYFSTNTPAPSGTPTPGTCSNLGVAKAYGLTFSAGAPAENDGSAYVTLTGGGLPPSAVGGLVQIDSNTVVPFCIGCGAIGTPPASMGGTGTEDCNSACGVGSSSIEACRVCLRLPETRTKKYWYNKVDQ